MDECNIIRLNNLISYISPTENPLSANVVMIQGKEALWLYDVGNHPDIPQVIEQFRDGRNVNVILSHFHEDHTGGLPDIACNEIYQGKYTYRHTEKGVIVQDNIYIQDGDVSLHIFPLPSSHAKGCVALEVNEEWCFLGDALYAMQKCGHNLYNAGVLKEEIAVLENVKAKHFMLSHRTPFETPKEIIMRWLGDIYDRRVKGEVYIEK